MAGANLFDALVGRLGDDDRRDLISILSQGFSPEARAGRGRAAANVGRNLEQYIPPNLRPLASFLVESNPVMGIDRAGDASARVFAPNRTGMERIGDLGAALSETAGVVVPMGAAAKVGRPAAEAMQEGLLGMSVPARSAAQAVIDRANQLGPVPTMYSNPLMGGGMSDPTQTGWTFRDVSKPITTKADNRRISGDTSRIEEVPINRLYATQPTVNTDFATTSSSAGEMPLVVRKGGKMFVQDGHHRLTKQAEGGAQTAQVRFIDLDNADTSTPLLDWSPEKTGFVEADQDLLDELFSTPASIDDQGSNSVKAIVEKYPEVDIDIYGNASRGYELGKIKVPEGSQGGGIGSKVMDDLIAAADAEGARISLTPDTSFGGSSVSRLKDFYKRFGFVENKGRNKDFSTRNTMYRAPDVSKKSKGLLD